MRIVGVIICLLFGTVFGQCQSTSPAAQGRTPNSAHVREGIEASNQSRMQWEAAQLSGIPVIQSSDPAEHHAVRIDQTTHSAPQLPKLRRELLSPEPSHRLMTSAASK
jgi:hypothetical protein